MESKTLECPDTTRKKMLQQTSVPLRNGRVSYVCAIPLVSNFESLRFCCPYQYGRALDDSTFQQTLKKETGGGFPCNGEREGLTQ